MKKKVAMIFTGGTIAMRVDPELDAATPGVESDELMNMVTEVGEIAETETIDFGNVPSPHMTPDIMFDLSKVVKENLEKEDITGVVITHGTDTLEETAYFLDLVTNSKKPIVVVGSMKNNSELGYDGAANIYSAIVAAIDDESIDKGVLVVMNNEIHTAKEVTKTNTEALDTFKSQETGKIGVVSNGEVVYYKDTINREFIDADKIENKVALIKAAAGMNSDIFDFYIENGYKGIVVEALGCGNLPPMMAPGIKTAIDNGLVVLLTSRCPTGRVTDVYGYEGGGKTLKDMGAIFCGNQLGQKLRIKLIIALGLTEDYKEIEEMFKES